MDTQFPILIKTDRNEKDIVKSNGVTTHLKQGKSLKLQCQLDNIKTYDFCGIGIALGEGDVDHGLDLTEFNRLQAEISYKAPTKNSKLKITFRNFNHNYSVISDSVSLKFNSISYNPNAHDAKVDIPIKALKVDNWWIEEYNVDFHNSQVELSNVSLIEVLTDSMNTTGAYELEVKSLVFYGQLITEANLLKLILIIWLIVVMSLVTLQRNKLRRMSMTDTLTTLYNRQGIREWTNKKIVSLNKQQQLYMFYLDLDDFKKVNDTYGHQVGDQLLIGFAQHIQNFLDSTQHIYYAFARLSGDEFALVVVGLKHEEINAFSEELLEVLDMPILLENHETRAKASLGIAQLSEDTHSFEALLARADSAMYYAKKEGKNRYKLFNESVSEDLFFRKQTAEKIKNAIINDQFHLNFMPIFDAKSLEMVSVEVLLRSHSNALKGIGPDIFIPIAEEYNLIKDIDLWVIEATFKQIANEKRFLNQISLIFCINISAAELHNPLFVKQLKALLKTYQIPPERIELEITETSLVDTDEMSISMLQKVRALGVKLTLDDFGTGYTAFSQLINYPVDSLKIDKSFIDALDSTKGTQATMIKAIITIADAYQLKTIGEGIELQEQYEFLVEHGCDMIQGYLFAKPMMWEDLRETLNDNNAVQSRFSLLH